MSPGVARALATCMVAAAAAVLLCWGRLPGSWRRAFALLTSGVGLLFLVAALGAEGHREGITTSQFLLGPRYVTGHASASASLPYYVVTAVCLLLGTAGLAVSDKAAAWLDRRWFAAAVVVSLLATAIRFSLETVVAPASWSMTVGVTWLAPVIGAYFMARLRAMGLGWRALVVRLVAYGFLVRGMVALLMVVATRLRLGTHYDVSPLHRVRMPFTHQIHLFEPGSWEQATRIGVLPQLTFWPLYTVLSGLLGAALFVLLARFWKAGPWRELRAPMDMTPSASDQG